MRCSILILFLVAASLFAQQSPVHEIRYRSVPDFLKLPPDLYYGKNDPFRSWPISANELEEVTMGSETNV